MKYIIKVDPNRFPSFIVHIFPVSEQHSEVAEKMKGEILGAGFVRPALGISGLVWNCYGESTSLNVASRGVEDSTILNALMPLTFGK